jgi:hypothetical protein
MVCHGRLVQQQGASSFMFIKIGIVLAYLSDLGVVTELSFEV